MFNSKLASLEARIARLESSLRPQQKSASVSAKTHTITTALINQIKTQYPNLNIKLTEKSQGALYGTLGMVYISIGFDMFTELEFEVWEDSGLIYITGGKLPRPSFLHTKEEFRKSYTHILNSIARMESSLL